MSEIRGLRRDGQYDFLYWIILYAKCNWIIHLSSKKQSVNKHDLSKNMYWLRKNEGGFFLMNSRAIFFVSIPYWYNFVMCQQQSYADIGRFSDKRFELLDLSGGLACYLCWGEEQNITSIPTSFEEIWHKK